MYVVPNRSMNLWVGALIPWASRMRVMIFYNALSLALRSTRPSMAPQRFIVSESRMSPGSLEIGRDSPVRFDSSHAVAP